MRRIIMRPTSIISLLRPAWRKLKRFHLMTQLIKDHANDLVRYWHWSHGTGNDRTKHQAMYSLLKSYHGVEKGLSLANPKPGFGKPKILDLQAKIEESENKKHSGGVASATSALHSYHRFGKKNSCPNPNLESFLALRHDDGSGGTVSITKKDIESATNTVSPEFFSTRHSIRNFSDTKVTTEEISRAVNMARKTPTVCNRQGPRTHVFMHPQEALRWQQGNRGFGHLASVALVVTCNLEAFSGRGERNQPYIDGGMFAMSLLYAFHSLGLGACPLAWSSNSSSDKNMRRALNINQSEAIIMMIAVGHLPDTFEVARSHRLPLEHFIEYHLGENTNGGQA